MATPGRDIDRFVYFASMKEGTAREMADFKREHGSYAWVRYPKVYKQFKQDYAYFSARYRECLALLQKQEEPRFPAAAPVQTNEPAGRASKKVKINRPAAE